MGKGMSAKDGNEKCRCVRARVQRDGTPRTKLQRRPLLGRGTQQKPEPAVGEGVEFQHF